MLHQGFVKKQVWAVLALLWLMAGTALAQPAKRDLAAVLAAGELRVGVAEYAPWSLLDKHGQLIGSEVDIARRLAADMGLKPVVTAHGWQELVPALRRGDIDVIAAGLTITPELALEVALTHPYRRSGVGLATNLRLTEGFRSLRELNAPEVAIAVLADTPSATLARRVFSRAAIKPFKEPREAEKAVLEGLVHAYVRANPAPRYLALKHPRKIDVPTDRPLLEFREALAVRKGDPDFVNFLNAWIVARQDDAWLRSTDSYWFESLDWQQQVQP